MTESEYNQQVEEVLARIEHAIDASGADIDYEQPAGGILELEFDNRSKIIINRQAAVQEIWVAAKSGGYHFAWKDGGWRNTRDGTELFEALSRLISEQAGQALAI